ncbi:MAG: nucleotidyl transferase AbiEii/AbiGii toxin family protein [Patescibacteria group bacterium]|nr:nucleotidyl transferase AbiEii/AbiGii toxin family protein [Patescibacteria group bacterium]
MLTLDQIKKNYSKEIFRKNSKAVLVEYLQYELLDSIFKQKNSEKLSFIGGTAIRVVYNSSRFSEDLDFDNLGLSYSGFGKIIEKVIFDMENKGFILEFRLIKKGAYHCYIKFPNLLFNNSLSANKDEKILVRIDTVRKNKNFNPEIYTLNGFGIYRKMLVNPSSIILSQKLITILQRKREKGRDFYDVSFLFGLADPDYVFLKKELGVGKDDFKRKILKKVSKLDMKDLSLDVEPFLINPDDRERVLSFKEYIEQKL